MNYDQALRYLLTLGRELALENPDAFFLSQSGECFHNVTVTGGKQRSEGPLSTKRELLARGTIAREKMKFRNRELSRFEHAQQFRPDGAGRANNTD